MSRAAGLAAACSLAWLPAQAQVWHIVPTLEASETWSSNVNLTQNAESDFVTRIAPGVRVDERGPHSLLHGNVDVPMLFYARTASENNQVLPRANLLGYIQPQERFFIEGAASVSQEYFSPFGAQPANLENATANRYQAQSYRVTPYVKGPLGERLHYELRDDNIWTRVNSAPILGSDKAYSNNLKGSLASDPLPFGWGVDYVHSSVEFQDRPRLTEELARLRLRYRFGGEAEAYLSGGREDNDYGVAAFRDTIYGGGVLWRPTARTRLDAMWEHRFFGGSYNVALDHRTPGTVWNVRAYRNVVSFPEQLGHFASTTDVPGLLDQLFQSLVPDPLLRQQYVDQFLRDRALPASLSSALLLFSHQVYLEEKQTASVALVGARNTIVFSLYHVRNDPIAGVDPTVLAAFTGSFSDVQRGASAIWTHKLTPVSTLAVDLGAARAEGINAQTGNTRQGHVRAVWSRRLSPRTTAYAGARYQRLHSDVTSNYSERAVFVGIGHFFQ